MKASVLVLRKSFLPRPPVLARLFMAQAVLVLLAILVFATSETGSASLFQGPYPLASQLLVGIGSGAFLAGGVEIALLGTPWGRSRTSRFLDQAVPCPTLAVSLLAALTGGVLAEIFFRAALQPLVGLWAGAVLFAAWEATLGQFSLVEDCRLVSSLFCLAIGVFAGLLFQSLGPAAAIGFQAAFRLILAGLLSSELRPVQPVSW